MIRSTSLYAAGAALVLASASSVHAAQLFGFNSPTLDGFSQSYDGSENGTASVTRSTTIGVSEGTGALRVSTNGPSNTFTQISVGVTGSNVPAALVLPGTISNTIDVTTTYGGSNFLYIDEVFFIDGTSPTGAVLSRRLDPAVGQNNPLSPAGTALPATLTYNLKNYADPFRSFTGTPVGARYTPGEIVANVAAAGGNVSISGFGFNFFNGATGANIPAGGVDPGINFYVDNFTIPNVPEPASLATLALGGLLLKRRR